MYDSRWWRALVLGFVMQGLVGCAGKDASGDGSGPRGVVWSDDRTRCESICEKIQNEGCTDFDHGACVKDCVDAEDFMEETTQCEADFRAFLSCVESQSSACIAIPDPDAPGSEACNDEAVEYGECLIDYCADNPAKDWCKPP